MINFFKLLHKYQADIVALVLILALGFFALRSLFSVPFYTSHDSFTHTARIAAYFDTMKDGQFPPRWAKNLNGQYGSPIFSYSYPSVYFLGAMLHIAGITYESAFRYILAAGFILSGIGAYLWLSRKFGCRAGFVGAIFYLWVPYHLLSVYVRGAIAENLAYAFLPFVLLAIEEIYRSAKPHLWYFILTFSLTATLLSHNLVSAISLPVFIVWSILWGWRNRPPTRWLLNALGLVTPFFLTAFIYLPDIFERSFIRFDQGISYYADHFVAWWQLIRSPWGYGFDLPGTLNDGMSFQIGLGQLFMLGLVLGVVLYRTIKDRKFLLKKSNWEVMFLLLLLVVLLVLMIEHPASRLIWKALPVIKTIVDFPWRLLGLVTVIMAYLASFLVVQTKNVVLVIVLVIAVLIANRHHLRVNEAVTYGDAAYDNYTGTSTAGSGEYTPVWHNELRFPLNSPRVDWIDAKLVHVTVNTVDELDFTLDQNPGKEIRVNRFYFPNTEIYRDGQLLTPGKDWGIIGTKTNPSPNIADDSGVIHLTPNPSGGDYRLLFKDTPLRDFSNKISLVSLIVILVYAVSQFAAVFHKKYEFD